MTLSDYADRWLTQLPHRVSARTVDAYRGALVRHILPHFGTRELASLHRRDIRSWCQGHLGTLAPNTVASLLTCLQALCTAAMDDELIDANPAHGASRNLWRIEVKPRRLTPSQVDALLTEAAKGPRWSAALLGVLVRTGLRSSEGLGLQAGDIRGRRLLVQRQYRGRQRVIERTKSGPSRWVDLSTQATFLLEERARYAVDAPHWLFSPGGDWPATRSTLQQHLRRIAKRAGLPAGLRVHDLRHSYSARLLELGAPMDYIQGQLGHASVVTTRRYTMGAEPPPTTALVDQLDAGLTEVRVRRPPHQIPPRLRLVRQRGVR